MQLGPDLRASWLWLCDQGLSSVVCGEGEALEGVWTVVSVLWKDEGREEGQGVTQ